MSNYVTTGNLTEAGSALWRAAAAMGYPAEGTDEWKLLDRIRAAYRTVELIEKKAKALVPGGFQSVPNAREEDKRAQWDELASQPERTPIPPPSEPPPSNVLINEATGRHAASCECGQGDCRKPKPFNSRAFLRTARQRRGG